MPLEQQKILKTDVDRMISLGVVDPSDSPWISPVVLLRKKVGSLNFFVDYRQLNKITEKDLYPLPNGDVRASDGEGLEQITLRTLHVLLR